MPGIAIRYRLSLRRGWPRRVRAAAVRAIAHADHSFTGSFAWAADSLNSQLRRQEEVEPLRREISLLREEIRIKNVRIEQIEPHRRPCYPPTARLAIPELRSARACPLAQTARNFLVTPPTIASWTGLLEEKGPEGVAGCFFA